MWFFSDFELMNLMNSFKKSFLLYLNHQQLSVRKLASKCLISFTPKDDLFKTLSMICSLIQTNPGATNFINGCLQCLSYGFKLLKTEYQEDFEVLKTSLMTLLIDLTSQKCYMNNLLLQDLNTLLEIQKVQFGDQDDLDFHPGARDFKIKYGQGSSAQQEDYPFSLDTCKMFISTSTRIKDKDSAWTMTKFMEAHIIDAQVLTGQLVESCNDYLQDCSSIILDDSELSMDLLDIMTHTTVIDTRHFGGLAASSSMSIASICFTSMVLKVCLLHNIIKYLRGKKCTPIYGAFL
jgi:hypothetical protein